MEMEKFNKLLETHKRYLDRFDGKLDIPYDEAQKCQIDLRNADLSFMNLRSLDLRGVILCGASLVGVDLSHANLDDADLTDADLRGARLSNTKISGASLKGADLRNTLLEYADFTESNLSNANLSGATLYRTSFKYANLCGANLSKVTKSYSYLTYSMFYGTNLENAKDAPYIPMACPEEGSFIGWKKSGNDLIIKLEIPADAKRVSFMRLCRCDKAKVLGIYNLDGTESECISAPSFYDHTVIYRKDKVIKDKNFDDYRWDHDRPGIHFLMSKQEAIDF